MAGNRTISSPKTAISFLLGVVNHYPNNGTAENLALLDLITIMQKLECGIMLINRLTHLFDTRIEKKKKRNLYSFSIRPNEEERTGT